MAKNKNLAKLEEIFFTSAKYADDPNKFKLAVWYQLRLGTSVGLKEFIELNDKPNV